MSLVNNQTVYTNSFWDTTLTENISKTYDTDSSIRIRLHFYSQKNVKETEKDFYV